MTDDAAVEAALDRKVTEQINQARIAAESDFPRQEYLRQVTGNPELYRGAPPKDLIIDRAEVLQSYRQLQLDNGSIRVARNLNRFGKLLPYAGLVTGGILAGSQAMAGDLEGAKGTLFETAVGEIPIAGDILSSEPAATGTLQDAPKPEARPGEPTNAVAKFLGDPMNELEWLGKKLTKFGGGIRLGW